MNLFSLYSAFNKECKKRNLDCFNHYCYVFCCFDMEASLMMIGSSRVNVQLLLEKENTKKNLRWKTTVL